MASSYTISMLRMAHVSLITMAIISSMCVSAQAEEQRCELTDGASLTEAIVIGNKGATIHVETEFSRGNECAAEKNREQCKFNLLKPGQHVIFAFKDKEYACIAYNKNSDKNIKEVTGWVKLYHIKQLPLSTPSLADWEGRWIADDATLRIAAQGETLVVKGDAQWPGLMPHYGDITKSVIPENNYLHIEADECVIDIWKFSSLLYTTDNYHCGASNVTFRGIYRKGPSHG